MRPPTTELAAVVGGLLLEPALHGGDLLDHLAGDDLEDRAAADPALHRARSPWRRRRTPAHRYRPDFARSSATASASALVASEVHFGMKRSMASSITAFVITEWPFSSARRRMPVRAIPLTSGGTRFIRSSASGVQRMLSSARTSSRGTSRRVDSRTSHGQARSRFSVLLPSAVSSLRAVDADPPQHEEPRVRLARVVEDLLEGLAVEERLLDRDTRLVPPSARRPRDATDRSAPGRCR